MRHTYASPQHAALADLVELETGEWLLTRVAVPRPHRGTGVARELLRRVLADADAEGVTLRLSVVPYGNGGLERRELAEWYARHGFRVDAREARRSGGGVMVRRPQACS